MRRRDFVAAVVAAGFAGTRAADAQSSAAVSRKGRLKQCAMRVNFDPKMPFDDMCREAARLGCRGFDLIGPQDWPTLRRHGLISTMAPAGPVTIKDGMLRKELHDDMEKSMHAWIDECAANGCPNIITVGGQRRGIQVWFKPESILAPAP